MIFLLLVDLLRYHYLYTYTYISSKPVLPPFLKHCNTISFGYWVLGIGVALIFKKVPVTQTNIFD